MDSVRDENCKLCKRHSKCKTVCMVPEPVDQVDLLVVFDSPNKSEDAKGDLMLNKLFSDVMFEAIEADPMKIHYTYALKCYSETKPAPMDQDKCRGYLEDEILRLRPKCILTIGEAAMYSVTRNKKVSKYKGKVMSVTVDQFSTMVVSTYSPYYVANMEDELQPWAMDLLKAWETSQGKEVAVSSTKIVYCDTFEKVVQAAKYCQETGVASFDFETPEIDAKGMGVFKEGHYATMLSLTFQVGSAYVIPLEHKESPFTKSEVEEIMEFLRKTVFENPKVRKIAHNLNYDYHVAAIYGLTKLRGRIDDTMLMGHLVDETLSKGLKDWVKRLFPEFAGYEEELEGFGWENIPAKTLAQYNGTDTDMTLRLCIHLENLLQEDGPSYLIYRNLTMAAFRHLWKAEHRGMDIDRDYLSQAIKEVDIIIADQEKALRNHKIVKRYTRVEEDSLNEAEITAVEEKLRNWMLTHTKLTATETKMRTKLTDLKSGAVSMYKGFNFNSHVQLSDLLYNSPHGFRFPNLEGGTGKDVLNELKDPSGFIEGLLLLRIFTKIQSTYLKGVYSRLDKSSRVHSSFLLSGTVTGRLSSRNPNFQNMPNSAKLKDETAINVVGKVKRSFVPPKGYKIVQADYSQAELRIIAEFANEQTMIKVYDDDGDLHAMTASQMMQVPFEKFYDLDPKEQKSGRTKAKAANFGLIYKISVKGFMEYAKSNYGLELTYEESEKVVDDFFTLYPEILTYHDTYIHKALKFGWVRTLFGRRRRTPDIDSPDEYLRSSDERVAVNSPIQGTAGEFTIFALALLYGRLDSRTLFVNTVHDSIIFYVPEEILETELAKIKDTMENLPTEQYFKKKLKRVKMKVDIETSEISWKDLG